MRKRKPGCPWNQEDIFFKELPIAGATAAANLPPLAIDGA
jgi:hypothetical protein